MCGNIRQAIHGKTEGKNHPQARDAFGAPKKAWRAAHTEQRRLVVQHLPAMQEVQLFLLDANVLVLCREEGN